MHGTTDMRLALARVRVRGRLEAVAASRRSCRGVALGRVVWGGLDPKLLIGPRAGDIEENLRLLLDFGKLSRFCDVFERSMAEKSSLST